MSYIKDFSKRFWVLNLLQMLEKMAYWIVLLQMPIYVAQKDADGGLHWEQTIKGMIFFWWALVQNFSPVFFGFLSDKYSDKKVISVAFSIIITSYILISFSTSVPMMIFSVILLGIGTAIFKPALQGGISKELNSDNQSKGWGIYFMLLNLAVFFGPPISKYLKEISWTYVFFGAASINLLNLSVNIIFNQNLKSNYIRNHSILIDLKKTFINLFKKRNLIFILSMSGFTIVYMQFYETLPNFFFDWTNTTNLAAYLPNFMLNSTSLGKMISYEWLYNINAVLVLFFVIKLSVFSSKFEIHKVLIFGILISMLGLFLSGSSTFGLLTVVGIVVYTFGEMLTNPKFTQYLSEKAGENNKSMYLSYLNISFGIGLTIGSLSGAWLYQNFAEKSSLAKYHLEMYLYENVPNASQAFNQFLKSANLTELEGINFLFSNYHPYLIWLPFAGISLISVIGLYYLYKTKGID